MTIFIKTGCVTIISIGLKYSLIRKEAIPNRAIIDEKHSRTSYPLNGITFSCFVVSLVGHAQP